MPLSDAFMTVEEISARLESRSLSSAELVDGYLRDIHEKDGYFHAFVEVYADDARQAAQSADLARRAGHALGPLHGVPIAIKDVVDIEGRRTIGGSAAHRERRSAVTATVVRRFLSQGMVILGKTHTVEFTSGGWGTNTRLGTPRNPWDMAVARTPGGSSSGSGVAVAAGLTPWALGTDSGGSVRLPASWCNLTALKVSTGRISNYGIMPLSPTLDTPGPMARTAVDARLLYQVLHGPDACDIRTLSLPASRSPHPVRRDLKGARLARMPVAERERVAADVEAAYDASIEVLRAAGAEVVDVALPYQFAEVAELNGLIANTEGYSLYQHLLDNPDQPLDEDVRPRLLQGRDVKASRYVQALMRREQMQSEMAKVFRDVDALLTPTTATAAIRLEDVDQSTGPAHFTRFANFFNLVALALPNGATTKGLPISLQIIGATFAEEDILRIGEIFQERTDWHQRTPSGMGS